MVRAFNSELLVYFAKKNGIKHVFVILDGHVFHFMQIQFLGHKRLEIHGTEIPLKTIFQNSGNNPMILAKKAILSRTLRNRFLTFNLHWTDMEHIGTTDIFG